MKRNFKLNGWQRIWIVFSITFLAAILVFLFFSWPNSKNFKSFDYYCLRLTSDSRNALIKTDKVLDKIDKKEEMGMVVEMPNGDLLYFKDGVQEKEAEEICAEYMHIVDKAVFKKRKELILISAMSWFGLIFIIYVFGWAIGWIIQGFKETQT